MPHSLTERSHFQFCCWTTVNAYAHQLIIWVADIGERKKKMCKKKKKGSLSDPGSLQYTYQFRLDGQKRKQLRGYSFCFTTCKVIAAVATIVTEPFECSFFFFFFCITCQSSLRVPGTSYCTFSKEIIRFFESFGCRFLWIHAAIAATQTLRSPSSSRKTKKKQNPSPFFFTSFLKKTKQNMYLKNNLTDNHARTPWFQLFKNFQFTPPLHLPFVYVEIRLVYNKNQ